jgi:hypothetical protein
VAGCGPGRPDFDVRGVHVVVNTSAAFARGADFPARLESTVEAALQFWYASWENLAGTTIVLQDEQHVACGSMSGALGCSEAGTIRITTRDPSLGVWLCVEQTVLVHEIGHAVNGDPNHDDPRWMDFVPVLRRLEGRVGYTEDGYAPCPLYVSVWRHVLHHP